MTTKKSSVQTQCRSIAYHVSISSGSWFVHGQYAMSPLSLQKKFGDLRFSWFDWRIQPENRKLGTDCLYNY